MSGAPGQEKLSVKRQSVAKADAAFWTAYNKCDTDAIRPLLSDDLEFYHDKAGPTFGLGNYITRMKSGICSDPGWRLRREPVRSTVRIFPLANANQIYGFVITGQHQFYVKERGKQERLNDRSRFVMLWSLSDGIWKASRIVSYDHMAVKARQIRR
jgi:hypothetical protein